MFLYSKCTGDFNIGKVNTKKDWLLIAGPCSVDSKENIIETALAVKKIGANILRGGAYKPRTSPYSFQGLEREGLKFLKEAGEKAGLAVVTEVMDAKDVSLICEYADIMQIGARNMQNFSLLKAVGKIDKPVLLKRGICAKLEDFLMAAEYILKEGNQKIILCERGIRTFCSYTRNTLDLSIIPALKMKTKLPIIVDPSHGTGVKEFILPMSKAAIAAGADGIMIEANVDPESALCDKDQALGIKELSEVFNCL